jgi:hypothetical protein
MSEEESGLQKGNTKMMKAVRLDLLVFMDVHEETSDLMKFIAEFFCEMGEYRRLEFEIKETHDNILVEESLEPN